MFDPIPAFPLVMSWAILVGESFVIALLGWEAFRSSERSWRTAVGWLAMVGIALFTGWYLGSLLLRGFPLQGSFAQGLIPLAMSVLLVSLYRLTFPPVEPTFAFPPGSRALLLVLTCLAGVCSCCLVVLDLFFS